MTDEPSVLVCRQKVHGIPVDALVGALREELSVGTVELARTADAERSMIADADVAVADTIDEELLAAAENLSLFACSYAGYDHLPLDRLRERGVTVTNASGVHASNVAEHAVGGLLSLTRGLFEARRRQRDHEWRAFQVDELAGSTVTVVGMGAIGSAICRRLQGFDVAVVGVRHSPEKAGPADEIVGYDGLAEALSRSAAVLLACPLTDETYHLLGREAFKTLPPEAVVVNVARGGVIDTNALVAALRNNKIGGAALDVTDPEPLPPDHPLWDFGNVLITPHNAGHTPEYYERLVDILAENVERAMETGEWTGLRNQVSP